MNNQLLGLTALGVFLSAAWRARRFPSALPATCMAGVFLVIAIFGYPLWEWSKDSGGAGLPPFVTAHPFTNSAAPTALLWAAIGAGSAAFLVPRKAKGGYAQIVDSIRSERTSRAVLALSVVSILVWLLGQGPSALSRSSYLITDGSDLALRVTSIPGPLLAVLTVWIGARTQNLVVRAALFSTAAVWFVLLVSIGTRTAVAIPLLAGVLAFRAVVDQGKVIRLQYAVLGLGMLLLAVLTITLSLYARAVPHGLLNLPTMLAHALAPSNGYVSQGETSVKMLVASIAASYPIIERSESDLVGLDVLLGNADPLPGTALDYMLERYQPFEWVPLAMVGEWFQVASWAGQLFFFAALAWLCGCVTHNLLQSRFSALSMAGVALALVLAFLCVQYSSRMVWRFAWIALFIAIGTYLLRQRRSRRRDPTDTAADWWQDARPTEPPQSSHNDDQITRRPVGWRGAQEGSEGVVFRESERTAYG